MASSQVLTKGDASAILDPDHLTIKRDRQLIEIPLAAVQEVRADGDTTLVVVLTDGAAHRIDGANATATAAFRTALDEALPEDRDPAGSSLVTMETEPADKTWQLWVGLCAVVLGYIGYVVWVGFAAPDSRWSWQVVLVAGIPLALGLVGTIAALGATLNRVTFARRGITVQATMAYHANGRKLGYYTFTDQSGNQYAYHPMANRSTQSIHVVYDPRRPSDNAARRPPFEVALMHVLGWLLALACMGLGVAGAAAPFLWQ
ncbi:DUF3592 domain-containing protein [Streptomyces kutzneri]|uniref:DUF3592 domain-containing protein n=1 Tax=Streptomyces kutzneri TaxID=3051179 RepID=UPI0028D28939|nr:DUF3592 domain-containing protein [Streptomyces sp. DSM 40907]